MRSTREPVNASGRSIRFRGPASSESTRGSTTRPNTAAAPTCGPAASMIRSSTTSTCRRPRRPTTTTAVIVPETTSLPRAWSVWRRRPESASGTFRRFTTASGTTTSPRIPSSADITVDGRQIKAVVQVSKQGFTYVFDRKTGEPVWPIEERPVPASTVPGERTSPTQPFPTKPPPFDLQGTTEENLIDFTPELRRRALEQLKTFEHGPLFTPLSLAKSNILVPGIAGGANWGGAGFDPDTGVLYVPSRTVPDGDHAYCGRSQAGKHALSAGGPRHGRRARNDRRPVDLQAAVFTRDRHRLEYGRASMDGAGRGWTARSSAAERFERAAARRAPAR